jgi:hypothetical protein
VVNALDLDNLVTAPVKYTAPVTTIEHTQYTGTIVWRTAANVLVSGYFAPATVYKAILTLSAKTGYTLIGVAAESFSYTGATMVTNGANSGTIIINFPVTGPADPVVTALNLDSLVTAPFIGAAPVTTGINHGQYTGTIEWQTAAGAAVTGNFAIGEVYKAVLTLFAATGHTIFGLGADAFSYTGAATVTNAADSGTVTITFPVTANKVVDAVNLNALVRAPVRDTAPVTTPIDQPQYTGTIAWQTDAGAPFTGNFAPVTVYKAIATLTAKTGWTFEGIGANAFTHSGATAVTNGADSGTVTITFQQTVETGAVISLIFSDEGEGALDQGSFTLSKSNSGGYADTLNINVPSGIFYVGRWRVDNDERGGTNNISSGWSFAVYAADWALGGHVLSIWGENNEGLWSKNVTFTVIN